MTPLLILSQDISGRIIDIDHNPVIGAYMVNVRSMSHYHTNEIGKFNIDNAELGDTILISFIGFEKSNFVVRDFNKDVEVKLRQSRIELSEIVVSQNRNQTNVLTSIDVTLNPVKSSQELLRKVPGLFIGQHAGGGKSGANFSKRV